MELKIDFARCSSNSTSFDLLSKINLTSDVCAFCGTETRDSTRCLCLLLFYVCILCTVFSLVHDNVCTWATVSACPCCPPYTCTCMFYCLYKQINDWLIDWLIDWQFSGTYRSEFYNGFRQDAGGSRHDKIYKTNQDNTEKYHSNTRQKCEISRFRQLRRRKTAFWHWIKKKTTGTISREDSGVQTDRRMNGVQRHSAGKVA